MKLPIRLTLLPLAILLASTSNAQQLQNNSFENWENVEDTREPNGWNTIMSGDLCRFCSFIASQRAFQDTDEAVHGKSSVRIESKSILGGVIFNGSVTTGRIAVPSASASAGYNQSRINEKGFHQKLTQNPDSLVFWAKYNITDKSDSALVVFFVHGNVELKVPIPAHQQSQVVSSIRKTFQTNGRWERISLPFKSGNTEVKPEYVLATFSSSFAAGKGNGNAKLWVDNVQLIYNDERLTSVSNQ